MASTATPRPSARSRTVPPHANSSVPGVRRRGVWSSGLPKPMENWSILVPSALAARKWPNSWTVITTPTTTRNGMT